MYAGISYMPYSKMVNNLHHLIKPYFYSQNKLKNQFMRIHIYSIKKINKIVTKKYPLMGIVQPCLKP